MKLAPRLSAAALVAALAVVGPAVAGNEHGSHHVAAASAAAPAAAAARSEGSVKKVDKAAGKITITHGPLENLGMPPMTMAFRAADPAMLDRVKVGDKIRFVAEKVDGVFTVTTLEAVK